MKHYREKTPKLGEGLASNVLNKLFTQIKEQKGMTTFIQRHGVNGCWMKPDDLYDIRVSKLFKILENISIYQDDDDFMEEWNAAGEYMLNLTRTPKHLIDFI